MENRDRFKTLKDIIPMPIESLDIESLVALKLLLHFLHLPQEYNPSIKQLTEITNISDETIRKGISYLIEHNIITIKEKYVIGKKNTRYSLNNPKNWKKSIIST